MHRLLRNTIVCHCLCLVACMPFAGAQVYSNDMGVREANFVAKVVLLDEFIHRFNNDTSSEIRRYYLDHHRPFDKSRAQLIRSLFNYSTQSWDSLLVERFIRQATDPENPDLLGFLADRWYAEAKCRFLYNAVGMDIRLILRVRLNPDHSAEWVIVAVKPEFDLRPDSSALPALRPGKRRLFIQPTANDTYFAELERDFADKPRLGEIFDSTFMQRRYSESFYRALLNDKLKFIAVKELKYHYLQVRDWIFTVENFDRDTRNSGWLISSIRQVDPTQRSDYEKRLLEE
jgi:hypothetical protein